MVAVNKVDLDAARRLKGRTRRKDVLFVSALSGEGLPELMNSMVAALAAAPEVLAQGLPAGLASDGKKIKLPERRARAGLVVAKEAWGFAVTGDRVEHLVDRTDLDSEGALARFQSELDKLGVNVALESAGVQPGDTVRIAGAEFEYQP